MYKRQTYFKALACDHFRRIKKNAYTIVKSNAVNALDDAERMIATEDVKPDVVFFDMPGTLRSNGVIKTLSQMDYIFTQMCIRDRSYAVCPCALSAASIGMDNGIGGCPAYGRVKCSCKAFAESSLPMREPVSYTHLRQGRQEFQCPHHRRHQRGSGSGSE